MTVNEAPTSPSEQNFAFDRIWSTLELLDNRVVLTAVFAAILLAYVGPSFAVSLKYLFAFDRSLETPRTVNAAEALGFYAIAIVVSDFKTERILRWWDLLAIATIATPVACVHRSHWIAALGITILGLLFVARRDERLASLGQLCLGLAWIGAWGALVLSLIDRWLLPMETALAYAPLSLFGSFSLEETVITNEGNGFAIKVYESCSSFHNTMTAAFVWLALMKIQRLSVLPRYLYILASGTAVIVVLNTARLAMLTISESQYHFWHLGPGLVIVKTTMLAAVLGIYYLGLRPIAEIKPNSGSLRASQIAKE